MNLKNTELLMKAMEQNKDFDSYGVLVSINGNKKFIHSDNVNYETYFDIASINMRSGFKEYDYSVIEKMREKIHNEIYKDLIEENLI